MTVSKVRLECLAFAIAEGSADFAASVVCFMISVFGLTAGVERHPRKMRPGSDGSTGQPFCGEFNVSRTEMLHEMADCEYVRCEPIRFNYLQFGRPCADQNQDPVAAPETVFYAQLRIGIERAVENINASGRILGQQLVVSAGDDAADPKEASPIANSFVGDEGSFMPDNWVAAGRASPKRLAIRRLSLESHFDQKNHSTRREYHQENRSTRSECGWYGYPQISGNRMALELQCRRLLSSGPDPQMGSWKTAAPAD